MSVSVYFTEFEICFTEFKCIFECVSVCFTEFKYIWMCENANLLLGCPPRWVARNSCCRTCLWGAKSYLIWIKFFFRFCPCFFFKRTFSTFWFCQGSFDLFPLCQFLTFPKGDCRENVTRLQTHLKSCLPSSLTSILRPILSWMLMPVISSFTKMQIFQKCQ